MKMDARVLNISNGVIDLNLPDREVNIFPFQEVELTASELETEIVQIHVKNKDLLVKY